MISLVSVLLFYSQVGGHDKIGMQLVPLKLLMPNETKEFTLDLVKNMNANDPQNKKRRGQLVVELTYVHFKSDSTTSNENGNGSEGKECGNKSGSDGETLDRGGLLLVMIQGAEDVEGEHHNNPYALIHFRGEKRKTKVNIFPLFANSIFFLEIAGFSILFG